MLSYSPWQMLQIVAHIAWTSLTRPQLKAYRTFDPAFYPNPYPVYQEANKKSPIFYVPRNLCWAVCDDDYHTMTRLLKDERLTTRFNAWKFYPRKADAQKTELDRLMDNMLFSKQRTDHQRLRRLAVPAFAPRIVQKLVPQIRSIVNRHLDEAEAKGISSGGNLCVDICSVCTAVPLEVLTYYLGVPPEFREDFYGVSDAILGQFYPDAKVDVQKALNGIHGLKKLVAEKRAHPQDDLISALATTVDAGDKLSEDEMLSLIASVLAAGPDSSRDQMAWGLYVLSKEPAAWQALRADPGLIPKAFHECIRINTWGHRGFTRIALEDMEILGQKISKGEMVQIAYGNYLRNEKLFPDPTRFDMNRPNLEQAIPFGIGAHYCLGAGIARAINDTLMEEMLARYSSISLRQEPPFEAHFVSRRMRELLLQVKK